MGKPVAPETITDDQIRRLKRATIGMPEKTDEDHELIRLCGVALTDRRAMAFMMEGVAAGVQRARQRICDAINARASKESDRG